MSDSWPEPAYAIRTARLTIRCYERADVRRVHPTILASLGALRPWMPWTLHEPISLEERAEQLRAFRARFDAGQDFIYGMFEREGGLFVGGCGLHPRVGPRALEIGYWLVEERWGRGLGTEIAAALTRVGFERMGAERMEIRVVPHNARSLAIPRRLGYTEEGTLRAVLPRALGPDLQGGGARAARDGGTASDKDDLVVFGMLAAELRGSQAARAAIETEGFAT